MARTIAIFGGTFDPVHHGHLIVARSIAEQRGLGRILLQPAASPPHKPGPEATGSQRLEMLRLAMAGQEVLGISDIELTGEGPSYTIDAVERLAGRWGDSEIRWIIGADMLDDLPNWHRAEELVERIGFLIAARPGWQEKLAGAREKLSEAFGQAKARRICQGICPTPLIDISSTDIRHRCREHRSIRYLVPEAVEQYVRENRLYGDKVG